MKFLVTGSAGFIGSALADGLSRSGHEVVGVDNYSSYYSVNLKKSRTKHFSNFSTIEGDISNAVFVHEVFADIKPDFVYHMAAQPGVRLPIDKLSNYTRANLVGFQNIATEVIQQEVPYFVYASSSSVYGDKAKQPFIEDEKNIAPNSYYGVTKFANELAASALFSQSNTAARGLRFFTVYGPWGRPDMAYFRIMSNLISETKFTLFGDGSIKRDFTYIDDVVEAAIELGVQLQTCAPGFHDVVNIGGGRPVSMGRIIEISEELTKKNLNFEQMESDKNDSRITVSDTNYLRSLVKFSPKVEVESGLEKFYRWATRAANQESLKDWVEDF